MTATLTPAVAAELAKVPARPISKLIDISFYLFEGGKHALAGYHLSKHQPSGAEFYKERVIEDITNAAHALGFALVALDGLACVDARAIPPADEHGFAPERGAVVAGVEECV